jgi:hypothetical protein
MREFSICSKKIDAARAFANPRNGIFDPQEALT